MIDIKGEYTEAVVFADTIDNSALGQLTALCGSPSMAGTRIRIMPDVHTGSWVIGTTIRFKDRIIPPSSARTSAAESCVYRLNAGESLILTSSIRL